MRHQTKEHIRKRVEKNSGQHRSEEVKKKMSESAKGHKVSLETLRKMSKALKGKIPWNKGKSASLEVRRKISESRKGMKYPIERRIKMSENKKMQGKNNPNWKGGITPINNSIRTSMEARLWKGSVFFRDDWTCQDCGKRGNGELHAHHIKPFATFPDLRFAIDNGITLCKKCHKKIHKEL